MSLAKIRYTYAMIIPTAAAIMTAMTPESARDAALK